mgnify:CR=1 FL=1
MRGDDGALSPRLHPRAWATCALNTTWKDWQGSLVGSLHQDITEGGRYCGVRCPATAVAECLLPCLDRVQRSALWVTGMLVDLGGALLMIVAFANAPVSVTSEGQWGPASTTPGRRGPGDGRCYWVCTRLVACAACGLKGRICMR